MMLRAPLSRFLSCSLPPSLRSARGFPVDGSLPYGLLALYLRFSYARQPMLGHAVVRGRRCDLHDELIAKRAAGRRDMRSSNKADSARIVCLSLFLVCSFASALAQDGPSSESQPIASIESPDAGTIYKVPGVSDTAQSSSEAGPALSGNFFHRLGGFYKADWTGKLPARRHRGGYWTLLWTRLRSPARTGATAERRRSVWRTATSIR